MTVELGAGDTRQVERIGHYVGDVGVADRLLPVIAGAAGARAAKAGVEVVEVAPGFDARAQAIKEPGNPQACGVVMRCAFSPWSAVRTTRVWRRWAGRAATVLRMRPRSRSVRCTAARYGLPIKLWACPTRSGRDKCTR